MKSYTTEAARGSPERSTIDVQPPLDPPGPYPLPRYPSGHIKAVGMFKALVWAREHNLAAEGREMIRALYDEGWSITPISPRRRKGGR